MTSTRVQLSEWIGRAGGCQCGAVRYRIATAPLTLYTCHCRHCQKQSASAFGMSLWILEDSLELTCGRLETWNTQGDSGGRKVCAFCGRCGTRIYHAFGDDGGPLSLKPGTLDDTSDIRPVAHIWTRRAQPWLDLSSDGAPCYPGEPDSDEELLALWQRACGRERGNPG